MLSALKAGCEGVPSSEQLPADHVAVVKAGLESQTRYILVYVKNRCWRDGRTTAVLRKSRCCGMRLRRDFEFMLKPTLIPLPSTRAGDRMIRPATVFDKFNFQVYSRDWPLGSCTFVSFTRCILIASAASHLMTQLRLAPGAGDGIPGRGRSRGDELVELFIVSATS